VGPFKTRQDAERFIKLMESCGGNWAGIEAVENEGGVDAAVRMTSSGRRSAPRWLLSQVIEAHRETEDGGRGE
jgi:hypothetical protein